MKNTLRLLPLFLFFSCASVHLPVPGESAIKRNSIYAEYMNIADAYTEQAKYAKAVEYYALAMKNKKLYWSAVYKSARAYALDKKWAESERLFKKLSKRDPNNSSVQLSLAYVYAMNGNVVEARSLYEQLLQDGQSDSDVLVNYITVLIAMEDYDTAKNQLELLKEKFKDNSAIADFERAIEEYEESIATPDTPNEIQ